MLTSALIKFNRKKGLKSLGISIVLAILGIVYIVLVRLLFNARGHVVFNFFAVVLPFSPLIILFSNYRLNMKIKKADYSVFVCEICELVKDCAYIKGIPSEILVDGVKIVISSDVKNVSVGDKVLFVIIGNDFYTVPYDEKVIC